MHLPGIFSLKSVSPHIWFYSYLWGIQGKAEPSAMVTGFWNEWKEAGSPMWKSKCMFIVFNRILMMEIPRDPTYPQWFSHRSVIKKSHILHPYSWLYWQSLSLITKPSHMLLELKLVNWIVYKSGQNANSSTLKCKFKVLMRQGRIPPF